MDVIKKVSKISWEERRMEGVMESKDGRENTGSSRMTTSLAIVGW
jgi:hypothetical protein